MKAVYKKVFGWLHQDEKGWYYKYYKSVQNPWNRRVFESEEYEDSKRWQTKGEAHESWKNAVDGMKPNE